VLGVVARQEVDAAHMAPRDLDGPSPRFKPILEEALHVIFRQGWSYPDFVRT